MQLGIKIILEIRNEAAETNRDLCSILKERYQDASLYIVRGKDTKKHSITISTNLYKEDAELEVHQAIGFYSNRSMFYLVEGTVKELESSELIDQRTSEVLLPSEVYAKFPGGY